MGKLELELINEHPIDYRITFDEKGHVYSFDGVPLKQSVTEFISQYFEKFDADVVIEKMKKGNRWPRPEYSYKVLSSSSSSSSSLLLSSSSSSLLLLLLLLLSSSSSSSSLTLILLLLSILTLSLFQRIKMDKTNH